MLCKVIETAAACLMTVGQEMIAQNPFIAVD
jgi:hypothetical protein